MRYESRRSRWAVLLCAVIGATVSLGGGTAHAQDSAGSYDCEIDGTLAERYYGDGYYYDSQLRAAVSCMKGPYNSTTALTAPRTRVTGTLTSAGLWDNSAVQTCGPFWQRRDYSYLTLKIANQWPITINITRWNGGTYSGPGPNEWHWDQIWYEYPSNSNSYSNQTGWHTSDPGTLQIKPTGDTTMSVATCGSPASGSFDISGKISFRVGFPYSS